VVLLSREDADSARQPICSVPMTSPGLQASPLSASDPHAFVSDIEARLRYCRSRLLAAPDKGIVSISLNTPELMGAGAYAVRKGDFYWSRPAKQELRIGLGQAWSLSAGGQQRLGFLDATLQNLGQRWLIHSPDGLTPGPAVFAGFAFDPSDSMQGPWTGLPNALLRVPEVLLERRGAECRLTFSAPADQQVEPERWSERWLKHVDQLARRILALPATPWQSRPPLSWEYIDQRDSQAQWSQHVGKALEAIAGAGLNKLVLTRRVHIHASRTLELGRILAQLEARNPDCIHFAVPVAHRTLIGATPERLVCVQEGTAVADAIASTEPRDRQLALADSDTTELFDNRKARREHQLVVRAIAEALGPISTELVIPEHPHLMTLPNVHHLWSPIRARLRRGVTLLAAAQRLHPTPAVGGTPRRAAAAWLRAHNEQDRGWYTGALGWLAPQGSGELAVVLRCGLIDEREALLFAGAGIVDGSDALQEYHETQWKLQSMLEAIAHA